MRLIFINDYEPTTTDKKYINLSFNVLYIKYEVTTYT